MSEKDLIKTGIAGLDEILLGGISANNVVLVQGDTGTGKTLFGIEFIYRGIVEFGEPGLIVLFETSAEKLIRDAARMGWDLEELQNRGKLQIVFTSPEVLEQEMRSPDSLLLETAAEIGAQRIFIDGIGLLRRPPLGGLPALSPTPDNYRELLQQMIEGLAREKLTAVISHDSGNTADGPPSLDAARFLADTVIDLARKMRGGKVHRAIEEILKSRRSRITTPASIR